MTDGFQMVGIRPVPPSESGRSAPWYRGKPVAAAVVLAVIVLGCLCSEFLMTKDPTYLDLTNCNVAPNREFLFGTDAMGRDLFSIIWHGVRVPGSPGHGGQGPGKAFAGLFQRDGHWRTGLVHQ